MDVFQYFQNSYFPEVPSISPRERLPILEEARLIAVGVGINKVDHFVNISCDLKKGKYFELQNGSLNYFDAMCSLECFVQMSTTTRARRN